MNQQAIRPYEMSLWTLQDSFITVLKPIEGLFQGQVITPKISLKNDNTQVLTFSIPMYYRNSSGELVENPLWYNTTNGNLLVNLRKIKVIFNKGKKGEGVYEFIIYKITESHSGGQLTCEVEAEGLAFQELGKIGYKITLNYDEFVLDTEDNFEAVASLNYWAAKVFENTNWTYSIQMDWSSYDGVIDLDDEGNIINYENLTQEEKDKLNERRASEPNCLRRRDTIYEEEYVSSWKDSGGKLVPREMVQFQEKARIPDISKSNIYNITQDLAELFEVYCKYKYYYDDNYHIIGRECIFYNNFLDEDFGKFDINYPYQTNDIKRTLESTDTVTKMYVEAIDDVSIVDVAANKSKEDYILNFDYLYSIGSISQEQYDAIEDYTYQMHLLNSEYQNYYNELAALDLELVDLKARYKILLNSIAYDLEQINLADDLLLAIAGEDGVVEKTKLAPEKVMILSEKDSNDNTIYKINLTLEGIDKNTVKLYTGYETTTGVIDETELAINEKDNFVFDDIGMLVGFKNLTVTETGFAYLVCQYTPSTKYDQIKEIYSNKLMEDEAELAELEITLEEIGVAYTNDDFEFTGVGRYAELETRLEELQEEIRAARASFERMMGPALREGSWTPDDKYTDSGDRYSISLKFEQRDGIAYAFWDSELFDEELNNYVEEGVELSKTYYPAIKLTEDIFSQFDDDIVLRIFVPYVEDTTEPETQVETGDEENTDGEQPPVEEETPQEPTEIKGDETYLSIGAQLQYAFLKNEGIITPVLLVTENLSEPQLEKLEVAEFGHVTVDDKEDLVFESLVALSKDSFVTNTETTSIVYPRIKIESDKLKTTEDELQVFQEEYELEKYSQYTLLSRDGFYYITIKPSIYINSNSVSNLASETYKINYVLSNAALHLYLDALEVAKTNAFPQASYEVTVAALNPEFLKYTYQKLNKVANINDEELKFKDVQGYISEVDMDLEQPWNDSFTIQNYKTKFEDLFSRIVASTEQMKTNEFAYNRAASAFTANGTLNTSVIQNTINSIDLNYSFSQGELTIDEANGIWATSDAGVVAMRGGGIFCATERDSNNNWLWHSGITPKGINASLLQAGTIDTNLIRIYSGENVRFQMNGEGLFAYAEEQDGATNFNKYVVHNNEGLFLTEKIEDKNIDLVEISWDGLIIRNSKDEKVFYADEKGNLQIVGTITAQAGGDIAGWKITEDGLTASILDSGKTYSAGLSPTATNGNILWAGEKIGENYTFSVTKDGSLYATNAFISGTITADTIVGNLNDTTTTLGEAVRQLNVISISEGNSFKYSNLNLDGNITLEPAWLRFQIQQKNLSLDTWRFEKWDGETFTQDNVEDWQPITYGTNSTSEEPLYFENFNHLTFIVKSDIMSFGGEKKDFAYIKVIGSKTGEEEEYSTDFFLTNKYIATDKFLSLITPPSHTFVGTRNGGYGEAVTLSITLKNLDPESGNWVIDGEIASGITIINGNAIVVDESITRDDSSTILVPAESLINGKWYVNDEVVENTDKIDGNSNDYLVTVEQDVDEDGKPTGTGVAKITIPPDKVPEGGQIMVRYQLGNASRTAFVFKNKNGEDIISTQITSSNGNVFKNGNIETTLTVNLYEGQTLLNGTDNDIGENKYGYVWKNKNTGFPLKNIEAVKDENGEIKTPERLFLNKRTIQIEDNDFEDKVIYSCEIYSGDENITGPQEAEQEYKKFYPDPVVE